MMLRFLFVVVLIGLCHGFFHPVTNSIRTSTTDTNNKPLQMAKSYKEMLEEAKLKKAMKASGAPTTPSMPVSPSVPSTPVPSTPVATNTATTASSSAKKSTGKYQFNDEMYDHMKFVISKLTDKIKSGISLTPQELERFSQSVDAILADATGESQESAVNSRSNYVSNYLFCYLLSDVVSG